MNSRQMECFLAAAECRNLRVAGERVFASASTVSRQIVALEEEVGVQLFLRSASDWQLTPAGRIVYRSFQEIQQIQEKSFERAKRAGQQFGNHIRIAFFQYASPEAFFLELITRFKQENPDVEAELRCCEVCMQEKFLRDDQCDVVFAFDWQIPNGGDYAHIPICPQEIALYIGRDNACFARPGFRPYMLQNPTVWFIDGYNRQVYEHQVYETMQHFGIAQWNIQTAPNWDTAWMNVAAGQGIIVSETLVAALRFQSFVRYPCPQDLLPGEVRAYWKKSNKNPLVKLFINTIETQKNESGIVDVAENATVEL